MKYNGLPFQKIGIRDLANHIDSDGKIVSTLNVCGFLLCQKGWAKVNLGGATYTIHEDDLYIYAPSTFITIISWSDDLEGIAFKSTFDYILPFLERAAAQKTLISIRTKPCITLNNKQRECVEELANLFDRKVQNYEDAEEDSIKRKFWMRELECLAEAFITEMLLYYIDNQSLESNSANHKDKIIQQFFINLFQHYKTEREVRFYAEQQYLTPRYFSTIVKEQTGKTALVWISEMVISNACQLLAFSDMSIKEIALDLNFPSQSFFGKYFKQYMHCSPLQYRRNTQGE